MNRTLSLLTLLLLGCIGGCIDTGGAPISVALEARGTAPAEPIDARGVPVTLDDARLAFGPLTLCAGFAAGDNCGSALAEWPDAAVIDALDPAPRTLGRIEGIAGTARSFMFDLGYLSSLVETEPVELDAAAALGGSLRLSGTADVDGVTIPFHIAVTLAQPADVERGLPLVRSGASAAFERVLPGTGPVTVAFDPAPWIANVDFRALVEDADCLSGGPLVCAGQVERTCDADGAVSRVRECSDLGQVCLRGQGCVDRFEPEPGSQALAAVRQALLAGELPRID